MKRRIIIILVSTVISLAIVLATMEAVKYYVNRIYGTKPHHSLKGRVTWLVK